MNEQPLLDTAALRADLSPGGESVKLWGQRVRHRRTVLGVSTGTLAVWCDSTKQTIGRVESGQINPRDYLKLSLSRALGCEVAELFPYPTFDELADKFARDEAVAA